MKLIHTFKAIILTTAFAAPVLFAGNAFALNAPSTCGAACTQSSPNPHGFTSMDCYSCHSAPAPAPEPAPAPAPTGTVSIHATSDSCGSCMIGTAPSSVSAHKNVNSTMTACSACHTSGSSSNNTGAHESDDDHEEASHSSSRRGESRRGESRRGDYSRGDYSRDDDHRSSRSRRGHRDD